MAFKGTMSQKIKGILTILIKAYFRFKMLKSIFHIFLTPWSKTNRKYFNLMVTGQWPWWVRLVKKLEFHQPPWTVPLRFHAEFLKRYF